MLVTEYRRKIKNFILDLGEILLGNEGKKLIELLYGKKDVNEFKIAKNMNINIHQVRNMLYKLSNKNLVNAIRKRDRRSGWYIYYWTLNESRALEELKKIKLKKLEEMEREIKSKESTTFYSCKNGCIIMKEETALLHDFFCPECGELTSPISMEKQIKEFSSKKNKIKKTIKEIEELLDFIYKRSKEKKEKSVKKKRKTTGKKAVKKKKGKESTKRKTKVKYHKKKRKKEGGRKARKMERKLKTKKKKKLSKKKRERKKIKVKKTSRKKKIYKKINKSQKSYGGSQKKRIKLKKSKKFKLIKLFSRK